MMHDGCDVEEHEVEMKLRLTVVSSAKLKSPGPLR